MQNTNTAQLIPITGQAIAGGEQQATVNARELHAFLESGQEFANWIKNRIKDFGFINGTDFLTILSKTQGRPRTEYFLSLDMAKELSMLERNDKGRQACRYFIEGERQAKQAAVALPDFTNPAEAARAWAAEVDKNNEQRKTIIEQGERLLKLETNPSKQAAVYQKFAAALKA